MSEPKWPSNYRKVLQPVVTPEDTIWRYMLHDLPSLNNVSSQENFAIIKVITVKSDGITLNFTKDQMNRILALDDHKKFILISFANFRFNDVPMSKTSEYIQRMLTAGIVLNDITYRFYGHSNSQLKSRTCLLYACASTDEITRKLASLGDFTKIMSVGKRAKRIGLLFSAAEMGITLDGKDTEDIQDIEENGEVFTDGCGLISRQFAGMLARRKGIAFRNQRYIPSVMQIRYKGYKGIVTIEPMLGPKQPRVQFRKSMRKFKGCPDNTFAVLGYSKPYTFGRLNGELVTLLSCLGITNEVLLRKQHEYFDFIKDAGGSVLAAFEFLSYCDRMDLAERLVMEGLESVQREIQTLKTKEWAGSFDKKNAERVRIMVRDSRILYGVCDPRSVLLEDECHVRIMLEGGGYRTLDGAEVIVGRNPCLHPGDIRKFRAVRHEELDHLVDCIAFPVVGRRPAPSLMSGGDLDGDKFFVCWDKDLIPSTLYEAYGYPPAKETPRRTITHDDMIRFFARYNNASLGKVKNCYLEWVKIKGAGSPECQQLNALFSSAVDGEPIRIPEHLQSPPTDAVRSPFILDILCDAVRDAALTVLQQRPTELLDYATFDMMQLLVSAPKICLSEFELFQLVYQWARSKNASITEFMPHFDFGAFTILQKHWIASQVPPTLAAAILIYNGLAQSSLLTLGELEQHNLHWPHVRWKRLYSSLEVGRARFFPALAAAFERFHRKLLVIRIDDRLTVAVYVPRLLEVGRDNPVNDSVRLFAFTRKNERRHRANTLKGYQLFFDGNVFQLFQGQRGNTFVYMVLRNDEKEPVVRVSIALDKFDRHLQQYVGRVNRNAVMNMEIYAISNRDRIGHHMLDISMSQVDTMKIEPLIENIPKEYEIVNLSTLEWDKLPPYCAWVLRDMQMNQLESLTEMSEFEQLFTLCVSYRAHGKLCQIVQYILAHPPIYERHSIMLSRVLSLIEDVPLVVITIMEVFSDAYEGTKPSFPGYDGGGLFLKLCYGVLRCANETRELALDKFQELLQYMVNASEILGVHEVIEIVKAVVYGVRRADLAQEFLFTLFHDFGQYLLFTHPSDDTADEAVNDTAYSYFERFVLAIAMDYLGEIAETCSCDFWGIPTPEADRAKLSCLFNVSTVPDEPDLLLTTVRIDVRHDIRNGDHLRFRVATAPSNDPDRRPAVFDGIVESINRGTIKFKTIQPPPSELGDASWEVFKCTTTTTFGTMLGALATLVEEKAECCGAYDAIVDSIDEVAANGAENSASAALSGPDPSLEDHAIMATMNDSQKQAVSAALTHPLTLIWGPPGTGKTTVVVAILLQLIERFPEDKLLVTASTHNAVDNVLERFLKARKENSGSDNDDIIRVATEISKVNPELRKQTLDAFVGGSLHDNFKARKEATRKVKEARMVFTTCTGAGVGILRNIMFDVAIVDEASQVSEPNAIIPLVKGPRRVVLVGDHVQLRPIVRQEAIPYKLDTSLFERLYITHGRDTATVMLDTQYRMHPKIAEFPSDQFYGGKLRSGVTPDKRILPPSNFPWPPTPPTPGPGGSGPSAPFPTVFVPCEATESIGQSSKKNEGQARKVIEIVKQLLTTPRPGGSAAPASAPAPATTTKPLTVTVLTPYSRQVTTIKQLLAGSPHASGVEVVTVDAFQGRESDVIVLSTVRANAHGHLGFLDDARRLNVALTRAKSGLIVVGHEETLRSDVLWAKLLDNLKKLE